jgi:hypothetical protein
MRRINGASRVENLPEVLTKIYKQGKADQDSEPKAQGSAHIVKIYAKLY